MKGKLTIKKEFNIDRNAYDYHIYSNGRFYVTCETKKQAERFVAIAEAN